MLEEYAIVDPASPDDIVGRIPLATRAETEHAISAATNSFPTWSALSATERATYLNTALDGVLTDTAFLTECERLLTLETGKILHESHVDFAVFAARWRLAMELAPELEAMNAPAKKAARSAGPASTVETRTTLEPLGTVTIIVPYNWPVAILGASLPAALLAGNTAIVKPPLTAPLATARFVSRLAQALPAGVLSTVVGLDTDIEPLITDARIAKVCFTGSVVTGSKLMALSAPRIGRLTLELGGNDPAIICEDANLDDAHVDRIFHAIFDTTGQICMNIKRLYVHSSRVEELVTGLEKRLETVVLGHGLDEATTHGPVHTAQLAANLEAMLVEAEMTGAEVRRYGNVPETAEATTPGYFVRPALVLSPDPRSRIVTDEQFGPIIPIILFESEADALAAANDTWAGLGGSVWSADESRAVALATQVVAGYVWVNDHGAPRLDLSAPFGGWRQSGFGREQGLAGLRDFMDTRTVAITRNVSA